MKSTSACSRAWSSFHALASGNGRWHVLTVTFFGKEQERAYLASQEQVLLSGYLLCGCLGIAATVTNLLLDTQVHVQTEATWVCSVINVAWIMTFSLVCLIAGCPALHTRFGPYRLELFMAVLMALTYPSWLATDVCYVTQILGYTLPKDVGCVSDSRLLLGFDALMTIQAIGVRVRWCVFLPASLSALLSYFVPVFILGSPETKDLPILILLWSILVSGASCGKRMIEHQQRALFLTVIQERSLRYEAERKSEHAHAIMPAVVRDFDVASSVQSLAETTGTGGLFKTFMEDLAPQKRESLEKIVELGMKEHWLIDANDLHLQPELVVGAGSFGKVMLAHYFGSVVAVKVLSRQRQSVHAPQLWSITNELRVLRLVRHPNLVMFMGASITPSSGEILLVLDYVHGLPLDALVADEWWMGLPSTPTRCKVLLHVCSGLWYLHRQSPPIVHGDLKASNVLVQHIALEPNRTQVCAKLCDFGLSSLLTKTAESLGGSFDYQAPELLRRSKGALTTGVDVFAFGRLVFRVMSGLKPLRELPQTTILGMAKKGRVPPLTWPSSCPFLNESKALASECTDHEPLLRPHMSAVHSKLADWVFEAEEGAPGAKTAETPLATPTGSKASHRPDVAQGILAKPIASSSPPRRPPSGGVAEMPNKASVSPSPSTLVPSSTEEQADPVQSPSNSAGTPAQQFCSQRVGADTRANRSATPRSSLPVPSSPEEPSSPRQAASGSPAASSASPPAGQRRPNSGARRLSVPHFLETPHNVREMMTLAFAQRWNFEILPGSCCVWHSACKAINKVVSKLAACECADDFGTFDAWQCGFCGALDEKSRKACTFCGERISASNASASSISESLIPTQMASIAEGGSTQPDMSARGPHQLLRL